MPPDARLTVEIGAPGQVLMGAGGRFTIDDSYEEATDLRWPNSVRIYDLMRRTDSQISAVLRAAGLPIRRTGWTTMGTDVDPRVDEWVRRQLGLQTDADGRRRPSPRGVSFDSVLSHALLMLPLGFSPMEQVYDVAPGDSDLPGLPPMMAHLRKLGPRLPRSISRIEVQADGGLAGVVQLVPRPGGRVDQVLIPAERLVMFVNDQEGADWYGNSILRATFKHWMLKEAFLRLDGIAAERNSLGVPLVGWEEGRGTRADALRLGKRYRSGEEAAMALPPGYTFRLVGVEGQIVDLIPKIKYHDESIGRSALAMFLNLGHDRGSQSLGDTFVAYFAMAMNAVVAYIEEVLTEHVVRDLVALNFGPDEPYPTVVADEITPGAAMGYEQLSQLVGAGVVVPDPDLEEWVRRREGMPAALRPEAPDGSPVAPGMSSQQLAEAIQKIYLGVGRVISGDEARQILNRAGAGLTGPAPELAPQSQSQFAAPQPASQLDELGERLAAARVRVAAYHQAAG